jgi:2,3-bisphosphoglycerate-independent phosphoglycerate mutase
MALSYFRACMKYVILCGDGMGDYPVPQLGERTILQAADIPHMRRIAAAGRVRMVQTVPDELPPGSDVANLGLLGYDARRNYTGRAPIEAAGAGVPMSPADVAYRCNLVTVSDGAMDDYSAGHISTEEAHAIVRDLDAKLGRKGLKFHGGVQYRHLLIWRDGPIDLRTQPPHDIAGQPVPQHLPAGKRQDEVRALMEKSKEILRDHPVNRARIAAGKKPATQIWLWGQGRAMTLDPFSRKFGRSGGVISAVDLVRGIGLLAGLEAPKVPGATGFLDTNYEGKVGAALALLDRGDFAYLHVEAPDECGHIGDFSKKKQAIEDFDRRVVGPVWQALEKRGEAYRLVVAMDHRTPVSVRGHTREPVPMAVLDGPVGVVSREAPFDESLNGGKAETTSWTWISELLGG